ncbi:hypothetical protein [Pseudolactococcus piscium]|uniref:Uncharacterized protein n=1 Tax=Pseudolactococcus piscium MKFS47 TaxID=297352 RepID=A0A0D6DW32_9LACT|nr:hypothetical protein [Lactococcus piscium]CEN27967.1 Uncharacterized protein LACPI_0767 [Lactococcus piscium MKFS47]
MNEKQFKQQSHDLIINIALTIGTFTTSLKLTDDDLARTQKLVKKFDETLTEFIDSRKPKFKKGDYVSSQIFADGSFALVRLKEDLTDIFSSVNGIWYAKIDCSVTETSYEVFEEDTRKATPEEIAEYKAALNFHEHGRKPFVIKNGDLVANGDGISHIVENAHNNKELFLLNNLKLLATSEELEKWLGTADE